MKSKSPFVAVAVLFVSGAVFASSLIHTDLATLDAVRVVAVTGSLALEPIEELDRDVLEAKIERKAPKILKKHGLEVDEDARATLLIFVEKGHSTVNRELVAVSVRVELLEPVTLNRQLVWQSRDPFQATTWSDDVVDLVPRQDAAAEAMEWVAILTEKFAEEVRQAKTYSEREGLWQPN